MKTRIILSLVVLILLLTGITVYDMVQGLLEGAAAVGQLRDSATEYAASRAIATGAVKKLMGWGALALLAIIWITAWIQRNSSTAKLLVGATVISSLVITGCGPLQLEINEEIKPNETAFLVPLEGATKQGQAQFMSEDYLNANKVATKRVTIPTRYRTTGRGAGNYEWIATVKLIRVDRTPVTRVWTKGKETGTSISNQSFCVESRESVDFCAGATAVASITEADAAKYQYHFAGKPLAHVMDEDIRGYAGNILSREFGNRTLDKGRIDKAQIFATTFTETSEFFKSRGVALLAFGSSEGLQYSDPKIQEAINRTFIAENDKNTAENERVAQEKRNELNVAKAVAEREAAEEFAKAEKAQVAIRELEIRMIQAQATLKAAERWNGQLPTSILPQGSNMLFGLDRPAVK